MTLVSKSNIQLLLGKIFPNSFIKGGIISDLTTCKFDVPVWLDSLWRYLTAEFSDDLVSFEDIPIIQVRINARMLLLTPKVCYSKVLLTRGTDARLPSEIEDLLTDFGILLVDHVSGCVMKHPAAIAKYLRQPTYKNILEVILTAANGLSTSDIIIIIRKTSPVCKTILHDIINRVENMQMYDSFLRKLPIFQNLAGEYISIEDVDQAVIDYNLPTIPPKPFIDVSKDNTRISAVKLGATFLTNLGIIKLFFLPQIQEGNCTTECDKIMIHVLHHFEAYEVEDPGLSALLSQIAFVKTEGGNRNTPSELFLPEKQLRCMFVMQDVFPERCYETPLINHALTKLGIKTSEQVTHGDITGACCMCPTISDQNLKYSKAEGILKFLSINFRILRQMDGANLHILKYTDWIPILQQRPSDYPSSLEWYHEKSLTSPSNVRLQKYYHLVGSVAPVNGFKLSEDFAKMLGLLDPDLDMVITHLNNIVRCYDAQEKVMYHNIASSVYKYMSSFTADDIKECLTRNNITEWIWNGVGFSGIQDVVIKTAPIELRPYLYPLSEDIKFAEDMLIKLDVHEEIVVCDLVRVIQKLGPYHESLSNPSLYTANKCRQLINDILDYMITTFDKSLIEAAVDELLLPIDDGDIFSLKPLRICCYVDNDWTSKGLCREDIDDDEDYFLVHPCIAVSVCKKLGVPSLTSRILHQDGSAVSGFGQSEELTTRLKNLLVDYTDGLAIFKELIQNADDAGATEIKFLLDARANNNCMTHLLDNSMRECQGPALWAYNNSVFTDSDIANIIKLGGATKEENPVSIGKFGLGFNAVYNMTDVPSFLSRNYMIIFDPHINHIGKSIKNGEPGVKINLSKNKRYLRKLSDHFKVFKGIFGCELDLDSEVNYDGTLFRLPLRTLQQAKRSLISTTNYEEVDILENLKKLAENSNSILLFTQHVNKLEFHRLGCNADPRESKLLFTVNKTTSPDQSLLKCDGSFQDTPLAVAHLFVQEMRSNPNTFPLEKFPTIHATIVDIVKDVTQEGKSVLDFETEVSSWLITHALGTNTSLQLAVDDVKNRKSPIASVAILLSRSSQANNYFDNYTPLTKDEKPSGQFFCFMPLPVLTGTPVNINGSFAILSSRRSLCEKNDDDRSSSEEEWNRYLITDAVSEAYVEAVCQLKNVVPPETDIDYRLIWPQPKYLTRHCHDLDRAFYRKIISKNGVPVIQKSRSLGTMDTILLLDWNKDECREEAIEVMEKVTELLTVCLPHDVLSIILEEDSEGRVKERVYNVRRFLVEVFMPNIIKHEPTTRDKLMYFALRLQDRFVDEEISKTDCIPSSPDGTVLKLPKDLVHPYRGGETLFLLEEGMVPVGSYRTDELLVHLDRNGLQKISWELLLNRAETLQNVFSKHDEYGTDRCIGIHRNLLNTMGDILTNIGEADMINTNIVKYSKKFSEIRFLKICHKPKEYPLLPWNGHDETELVSSEEAIRWSDRYLASSLQPVIDTRGWNRCLKEFLGVDKLTVPPDICVQHLESIAKYYSRHPVRQNQSGELRDAIYSIYQYLQSELTLWECGSLKTRSCIFLNGRFVSSNDVTFNGANKLSPLLYSVPLGMKKYKLFLEKIGVRESFGSADYLRALLKLSNSQKGEPLDDNMVIVVSRIAHLLSDVPLKNEGEALFFPNMENKMKCASKLLFNTTKWLDISPDTIIHSTIMDETAMKLGIPSTASKHTHDLVVDFENNLTNEFVEKLRISHPFDTSILDHMVQTAEVNEATDVHFYLDSRTYPSNKVFSDEWKSLQGPALCFIMNKPLRDADCECLNQLQDNTSIPHAIHSTYNHLVWLCAAFQLTDVPSILINSIKDGTTLYILDPSLNFVGNGKPGCKFANVDEMRSFFPDVLEPFPAFSANTEGTFFRFPLKNKLMVSISSEDVENNEHQKSETISQRGTDIINKVEYMLTDYQKKASESLVFLEYVKSLKMTYITETNEVNEMSSFALAMTTNEEEKHKAFCEKVKQYRKRIEDDIWDLSDIPIDTEHYQITVTSDNYTDDYHVVQTIGSNPCRADVEIELQKIICKENRFLPKGGVALLSRKWTNSHIFPNVDLRANKKLLCNMPMHVNPGLPALICGDMAIQTDSTKGLVLDDKEPQTKWNNFIATNVIARAYVQLILITKQSLFDQEDCLEIPTLVKQYLSQLPITTGEDVIWRELVQATYKDIVESNIPIFPLVRNNIVTWHSSSTAYFAPQFPDYYKIKGILYDCGLPLVEVGQHILQYILNVKDVKCVGKQTIRTFFMADSVGWLSDYPNVIINTPIQNTARLKKMMRYCLDNYTKRERRERKTPIYSDNGNLVRQGTEYYYEYLNDLNGLPFLLTADNMLHRFQSCKRTYCSPYHDLLPMHSDDFLHPSLLSFFTKEWLTNYNFVCLCPLDIGSLAAMLVSVTSSEQIQEGDGQLWETPISIERLWQCVSELNNERNTSFLNPLKHLCILPAKYCDCHCLIRIDSAYLATTSNHKGQSVNVEKIITKFNLPSIDDCSFSRLVKLTAPLTCTSSNPSGVLRCLASKASTLNLTSSDCNILLKYFAEKLESIRSDIGDEESIQMLHKCSIFKSALGRHICLEQCHVYLVPLDAITDGMDSWSNTKDIVFLRQSDNKSIVNLYKFLRAEFLTYNVLYCKYIFCHFEMFNSRERNNHLYLLYEKYVRFARVIENDSEEMIHHMRISDLIECQEKTLRRASYFFDKQNVIFKDMAPSDRLSPKYLSPFKKGEWHEFLDKIGIISEITVSLYTEFATTLSNEKPVTKKQRNKSRTLIQELWKIKDKSLCVAICEEIKDIPFVQPLAMDTKFTTILPQWGSNELVTFRDCLPMRFSPLVWSQSYILPAWADPQNKNCTTQEVKDQLVSILGITYLPSSDKLIDHFRALSCKMHCSSERERNVIIHIVKQFYQHFQTRIKDAELMERLKHESVLLIDGRYFAQADHAVISMRPSDQMQPYLNMLPTLFGEFEQLFRHLGSTTEPSVRQLIFVQNGYHRDLNGNSLDDENYATSCKALKLFLEIVLSTSVIDLSGESYMYMPCANATLVRSTDLIFSDSPALRERTQSLGLQFIVHPSDCKMEYNDIVEALLKLPIHLKPSRLSDLIKEVILSEHTNTICVLEGMALEIQNRLKTVKFQQGIIRLINHQLRKSGRNVKDRAKIIMGDIDRINVISVEQLTTHLIYKYEVVVGESVRNQTYFLDKSNLYVAKSDYSEYLGLVRLSEIMNELTGGFLSESIIYLIAMFTSDPQDIDKHLDQLDISMY